MSTAPSSPGALAMAAARGVRLALRRARQAVARAGRRGAKRWRGWWKDARAAARGPAWAWEPRRSAARLGRRAGRFRELQWDPYLEARAVRAELAAIARDPGPVLVGPWLSEVGYEVLYWRPFLVWAADRFRIAPERLVAVSRGGVASWYEGVAGRYLDLLDLYTPDEFAARNEARRAGGDQKQLAGGAFDEEILDRVAGRLGTRPARVCHPSLMFRLFRSYWFGNRSLDFLFRHARFDAPPPAGPRLEGLPERYTAVKFYTGAALPDSPAQRQRLRALVETLARQRPLVVLDTGLALDEHQDFVFRDVPGVHALGARMSPATNLAVQTQVVAHADLFVGTCGGLAWLAPMLGVPTIGLYEDDRFLGPHLFTARHVYRRTGAAPFMAADVAALDSLGLLGGAGA